jgi:UDP-glucose:(heptosyl)LPS alpha-1,3-glucosyltransferase
MNLAFAIVSLFPNGGLQRDCMAIARLLGAQGHQVTIFTSRLTGGVGSDINVEVLPVTAWTNHGRNAAFSKALARRCVGKFDRIIGFDKLENLDVLYCADPPAAPRYASGLSRFLPRGRKLTSLEQACFGREARTTLLLLSQPQIDAYRGAWDTQAERITLLPPTINAARRKPQLRTDGTCHRLAAAREGTRSNAGGARIVFRCAAGHRRGCAKLEDGAEAFSHGRQTGGEGPRASARHA